MSGEQSSTVTCPKCGHQQELHRWQTLNTELSPSAKEQLMEGTLFTYRCEQCGYEAMVDYDLLYHDLKHQVMVYYAADGNVQRVEKELEDVETQLSQSDIRLNLKLEDYRTRIVTDQNTLREKAMIFDAALDDRVVEIVKLICFRRLSQDRPELALRHIYFFAENGRLGLVLFGREQLQMQLPKEMYARIAADYASSLRSAGSHERIVDQNWAMRFLTRQ